MVTGYWDASSLGGGFGGSTHSGRMGWNFGDNRPTCGTDCTFDPEMNTATVLREGDSARKLTGAFAITFAAEANQPIKASFQVVTSGIKDHSRYRQAVEVGAEGRPRACWIFRAASVPAGFTRRASGQRKSMGRKPAKAWPWSRLLP